LQAEVYVSARKREDFAWIEIYGYNGITYQELKTTDILSKFDVIFNTVPSIIFESYDLEKISNDAIIIDLASGNGGFDFNTVKNTGKTLIRALSLPGSYAPVSSAKILAKTVQSIIEEDLESKGVYDYE